MPHFPIYINLTGQLCIFVGGGVVAARKARTLLDFGANVTVLAPEPSEDILALSRKKHITLLRRAYCGRKEIEGAALVIAATDDKKMNEKVSFDARALGIPVNVADSPSLCTFFFPALVRRGDLVAGISTSGACPRLSAHLRKRLDEQWPSHLGAALAELKEKRRYILGNSAEPAERLSQLDHLILTLLDQNEPQRDGS